jgi:prostaglandin-H2 D-isomerase / glutathione transferase
MASSNVKVYYFDAAGRAEPVRLALTLGGVAFEDIRLNYAQIGEKKAQNYFKFGQVPVIEVDGKQYAESWAILTWAGKASGLYPSDALQALAVDEVRGLAEDNLQKLVPAIYNSDKEKAAELRKVYAEKDSIVYLGGAEKLLAQNGTGYFVGNSITIADIIWYVHLTIFTSGANEGLGPEILNNYPNLKKLHELIASNDKVKAWNDAHKK